jgi:hypothetical protein
MSYSEKNGGSRVSFKNKNKGKRDRTKEHK